MRLREKLKKREKNSSNKLNNELIKIKKRFYFDDMPWWGDKKKINSIDALIECLWQAKKLQIKYKKSDGIISERNIRPYGIVINEMECYVVAFCEKTSEIRTFKILFRMLRF
ncbi:MAG: WYL domain-containing protein [Clostridiaceae bacterium]|nr:WYL domain-containing protein [Clostridiaceae bacterium]